MMMQIHLAVATLLLLSLVAASPNYLLAQNISLTRRIDTLAFISDDVLMVGSHKVGLIFY